MVTEEEVKNIASLSKLYLTEQELDEAVKEIGSMVKFVNQIKMMDYAFETETKVKNIPNAFRSDEVKESFPREEILSNVNGGKDGFFHIERTK